MLGEDLDGTFRAMCPENPLPEKVEQKKPTWETNAERDARERRALVDAFFVYKNQTFENYDLKFNGHADDVRTVQKFIKEPLIKRLVLKGDVGRGKSHLAQACINAARHSLAGRAEMISATKLYWLLRDVESFEPDGDALKAYDRVQRARLLAIDDLGVEKQSDAQVFNQTLKDLLEDHDRRIIITTNLSESEMVEVYGQKIVSRLHEDAIQIILKGRDFRTR
jgi:DNA replication protein DnaC